MSWADENTIAVLHRLSDNSTAASLYTVGGTSREIGTLDGGKSFEARSLDSTIYAVDAKRNLYAYKNISWTRLASNVLALHFSN